VIPERVARFLASQLEGRAHQLHVAGASARIEMDQPAPDPYIEELARDDCYFRAPPRCEIRWDPVTGEIHHWKNEFAAHELGPLELRGDDDLVADIRRSIDVPADHARLSRVHAPRKLTGHLRTALWHRTVGELEVVNEYVQATLNITTGRMVDFSRSRWAPLPAFGAELPREDARRIAHAWMAAREPRALAHEGQRRHILWIDELASYARVWEFEYTCERPLTAEERELALMPVPPSPDLVEIEHGRPEPEPSPPPEMHLATLWVRVDDAGRVHAREADLAP
jgi:hypothetical protein